MSFFTFSQNNSGGYFIENQKEGVGGYVIIEAQTAEAAYEKLRIIGDRIDDFWDSCDCCGERWCYDPELISADDEPAICGKNVREASGGLFGECAFVHYENGKIEKITLK